MSGFPKMGQQQIISFINWRKLISLDFRPHGSKMGKYLFHKAMANEVKITLKVDLLNVGHICLIFLFTTGLLPDEKSILGKTQT